MPRKQQDPIVPVLDYFESQPIDSAKTALSVVTAIVVRRSGGKPVSAVKSGKRKPAAVGPGPVSEVGG